MKKAVNLLLLLMGILFLSGCSGLRFPSDAASQAEASAEYV